MSSPPHEDPLTALPPRAVAGGEPPVPCVEPQDAGRAGPEGERSPRPGRGSSATPLVRTSSAAMRCLAFLAIVASLHLGRAVVVPVALAAFVAFLLSPIARVLERLRIPRGAAATVSVLALAAGFVAVLWLSGAQAVDLARRLPEYRKTLDAKLGFLRTGGPSPLREASDRMKELGGSLGGAGPDPHAAAGPGSGMAAAVPETPAVAVRVVADAPSPVEMYRDMLGSVLGPVGDAAVVILLAIFLLAYRMDVRERLLALGSAPRLGVTSQAIEEAGSRVARYLLSNLAVNVLYGTAVGLGVAVIGVPNAPLWGLLCALLRFIPYIGTWVGAALPIAVSIAVFDGWGRTIAVFGTILGLDIIVGNVVEPVVYGHRTGLSPLAVVLGTVFWTWIWGIPGLLLAIPMTLCLAVLGRYVPGFGAFHVLLGDEPALDPAERAYERLIAFDARGASRILVASRGGAAAAAADDAVLLGALRRAERDRRVGHVDEERYLAVCDGVREAIEGLDPAGVPAPYVGSVLCLPAFAEADRVACEVLAVHLTAAGFQTTIGPNATGTSDAIPLALRDGVSTICVVALPPFAALRVRYGIRRARSQAPDARLFGIVLDPDAERPRVATSLRQAGANETTFTLADTLAALSPRAAPAPTPSRLDGPVAPPVPVAVPVTPRADVPA